MIPLTSLFKLYILTPGRRIYVLKQIKGLPEAQGRPELMAAIDKSIAHDRSVLKLEVRRGTGNYPPEARTHDIQIDRNLGVLYRNLQHIAVDSSSPETAQEAADLSDVLFPRGLSAHVHLPYVDQLAANERVVEELDHTDNQDRVNRLSLRLLATRLRELNAAFAVAIDSPGEQVEWPEIKTARARGQELYLQVVAHVVTTEDAEARGTLLRPIGDQNDAVRVYRRRRRRIPDVDPDTGEPTEDSLDDDTGEPMTAEAAEDGATEAESSI